MFKIEELQILVSLLVTAINNKPTKEEMEKLMTIYCKVDRELWNLQNPHNCGGSSSIGSQIAAIEAGHVTPR